MKDLTEVFNYILKQTIQFYIERKSYLENIDCIEVVPKSITKHEIYRAYVMSIYSIIFELQLNELFIYDTVVLSDDVEQTSLSLFEKTIYPLLKTYLKEKGIKVTNHKIQSEI